MQDQKTVGKIATSKNKFIVTHGQLRKEKFQIN